MAEDQGDRRREPRFPAQPPLECTVRGKGYETMGPGAEGKLRNLSGGGALFALGRRIPPGALVVLSLRTPAGPVEVEGEVLWAAGGEVTSEGPTYVHGLRFSTAGGAADPALEKLLHHIATLRGSAAPPAAGA